MTAPLTPNQREALHHAGTRGLVPCRGGFRRPHVPRRECTQHTIARLYEAGLVLPDERGLIRPTEQGYAEIGRRYTRQLAGNGR
ncbi:MAG: hypothetical protein LCH38_10990 [Proteobacteria bacterium]|nr:hypothetical protein [Pseudomonadota bacterium]